MSIEMRNKKHTRSIALIFLLVLFIALIVALKLANQVLNGTADWAKTIQGTNLIESKYIVDAWFTGSKGLSHFFQGPMGFKSILQFKLVAATGTEGYKTFLLPIFWDLLINWIAIVGIIFLVILLIMSFAKENRINKILSEAGSTTAPEVVKEVIKLEEKLEEEVVVKKPKAAKKPATKKVAEPKVEEVKIEEKPKAKVAAKLVTKKAEAPKTAEVKVEKVKSVATKKAGITYVIKKHYDQVSKKDILVKLEEKYSDFSKKSVKEIVDLAFNIMADRLTKNEEITINNFGKLSKVHKEAKKGINPLTGKTIKISASNTVKFKANKHLKETMTNTKWTGLKKVKK
ncbi:HU family DNA-binding protein [Mesoplasma melaleucae]|uniref:30S ribosomal protein S6 n=1 Tax=Mesoplasma melaleucae TaxID=81459 RepID=A0A2K8P043_9MOLU|nr:HU family DNA-binding protein [Mesoplasma melaleucae]ATZ18371.1 30S ribosomal protein S6 [Mesoplasma melaleucae]